MSHLSIDFLDAKRRRLVSWSRFVGAFCDEYPKCSEDDNRFFLFAFRNGLRSVSLYCLVSAIEKLRRAWWRNHGPSVVTEQQVLRFAWVMNRYFSGLGVRRIRSGWAMRNENEGNRNGISTALFVSRRTGAVFQGFYKCEFKIGYPMVDYFPELVHLFDQRMAQSPRDLRGGPKKFCLIVDGDPESYEAVTAIRYSVKRIMDIPYTYFRQMEKRIPGPLFRGENADLLWLADKLRQEGVSCRVMRVPIRRVAGLDSFVLCFPQMSAADAFAESAFRTGNPIIDGEVAQPRLPYLVRLDPQRKDTT